jgi:hypothetical protein
LRKGEPTYFVEKILKSLYEGSEYMTMIDMYAENFDVSESEFLAGSCNPLFDHLPKHHTIRAGHRWKVGDKFSPRVWSGQPYKSKQIVIGPDIEVKKTWEFEIQTDEDYRLVTIDRWPFYEENKDLVTNVEAFETIAKNDGLSLPDLKSWFKWPEPTGEMQIICWNEQIEY